MSKIYCGIGQIPKGSRLGSMKECADKNQVKYYGIKKIDPKLVETIRGASKTSDRDRIFKELSKNKGKVKRLRDKITGTKDKLVKDKLQKELEKLVEEVNNLTKQFNDIDKRGQRRSLEYDINERDETVSIPRESRGSTGS